MEEENLERQEEIKTRVIAIYDNIQRKNEAEENENKLDRVVYYETIRLNSEEGAIEFYNVYIVRIIDPLEKALYEIYDDEMLIATINENGHIEFSENYKQRLNEQNNGLFINAISKMEKSKARIEEPEELGEKDKEFAKQDILEEKKKKEEAAKQLESKDENIEDLDEDEQEEIIAEELGISINDIVCKAKINPKQTLTQSGMGKEITLEDIAGIKDKYQTIYVVNANKQTDGNKFFAFIGITKDGNAEHINLPSRGRTFTDRNVITINRNGQNVEEKQVTEMFEIPGAEDKAFSVTLGEYGIPEVQYLRRSPEENKYIGSPVETQYQRPTMPQVKKAMDDRVTSQKDLRKDVIPGAKEQLEEQNGTTNLPNIDPNKEDQALDPNLEIKLHDETITTLAKEAEMLNMSLDEYNLYFEKAEGNCPSDKIMNVRQEILEKGKTPEPEEREERTILTPEEEAWKSKYSNE